MELPKHSDADKARFRGALPDDPRVVVKAMFGSLGAFVNDNMFAGLFGPSIGVKLSPADKDTLTALGGGPFGPAERPMAGYVSIPNTESIETWTERALDHIATLPPKAAKPAKRK